MKICEYGCGREAKYYFPTAKKWCCSEYYNQCPAKRKETSEANKGSKNGMFGKNPSEETLKKQNEAKKLTIKKIQHKYKTFSSEEEMRYDPDKPEEKEIQVHCKNDNCPNSKEKGGWFTPTGHQVSDRRGQLEHPEGNDGCFLYCSQYCKETCPCYNVINDPLQLAEYQQYHKKVWKYTNLSLKYNSDKILNIELRGSKHSYDLDHKFSILDGFNNNIDPSLIGHWRNLEVIKASDNRTKSRSSSISIDEVQKLGALANKVLSDCMLGGQNI